MKKILFMVILFLLFIPNAFAKEKNLVNIYLFHMETCAHCKEEIELLTKLEEEYDNIKIYKFEINEEDNNHIFSEMTHLLNTNSVGVPFTVIGEKHYHGYSSKYTKKTFVSLIEYYSNNGYKDIVGEYLTNIELPSYEIKDNDVSVDEFITSYANYKYDVPLFGLVETNDLNIANNILLISFDEIFSISNLILLFVLISFLIKEKNLKNILIIGLTYLFIIFIINTIIIISNISINLIYLKYLLAIFLILISLYNLIFKNKESNIYFKLVLFSIITLFLIINNFNYTDNYHILNKLLYLENIPRLLEIFYILVYIFLLLIDKIIILLIVSIVIKGKIFNYKSLLIISSIILLICGVLFFI